MWIYIAFLAGVLMGCFFTVLIMSLCIVSAEADQKIEKVREKDGIRQRE